jgi:hypothetical protein
MPYPQQNGHGQPMPMPYPQPYGYAPQMPNSAMMRPMFYAAPNPTMMRPMPATWQAPPAPQPRVYNFGPLTDAPPDPITLPTTAPIQSNAAPPVKVAPTNFGKKVLPALPAMPTTVLPPDACGPECLDACGPTCAPPVRALPAPGRGHFISTLGAWYLVPYPGTNSAFTTTTGGTTTTTDFAREMQYGVRGSLGYVFHNCWGIRGNYSYLVGDVNASTANANPATTISTPLSAPFNVTSPSAALLAGFGPDQFNFRQKFEFHVADVEVLREARFLDTTFLFSAGARYARIEQTYIANRNNPGGINGATSVALDQADVNSASLFSGWGPTVSFDVAHPILPCGISIYGNARGSYLFGMDRFSQTFNSQSRSVTGGVANFASTSQNSVVYDSRAASIVEGEAGLQCGVRLGRCYVFGRAGAVYQRWFDVGSPTTSQGNLSFIGGTATVGITY